MKKKYKKSNWRVNLVGKKFGRLFVLADAGNNKYGKSQWKCKCDCGNIIIRSCSHLCRKIKGAEHQSCGCWAKELSSERGKNQKHNLKPKGQYGFNCVYQKYKYTAKINNRIFDLTKNEFLLLTQSNCWYCGNPPSNVCYGYHKNIKKETQEHSAYIYNGIDRIENSKGYILSNSISCCVKCNRAKMDMSIDEFKQWIIKISQKFLNESK